MSTAKKSEEWNDVVQLLNKHENEILDKEKLENKAEQ